MPKVTIINNSPELKEALKKPAINVKEQLEIVTKLKASLEKLQEEFPTHARRENAFKEPRGNKANMGNLITKAEVMRWLASDDPSERTGTSFKAHPLAENIILLTYISRIKDTPVADSKQAMRSSIWRLTDGQWRMVFHQGTPLK